MPRDIDDNNRRRTSSNNSKKKKGKGKSKRKVFTGRMRKRLLVGMLIFCVLFCVILGKIIYFNIFKREEYNEALLGHKGITSSPVPYKRGDIYDCNGSVLATSTMMYNLIIEPANITENEYTVEPTVKALKKYFNIPEEETYKYLEEKDSFYNVIRKKLTYDDVKAYLTDSRDPELKKENLKYVVGIQLEIEYKRTYPNNELGCHMLGFVIGGNEGLGGIEGGYNSYLNGQNGRNYSYLGEGDNLVREVERPVNGNSLVTTIDSEAQRIVQTNVEEFEEEMGAKNISVLVMNPKNCEILALYNSHQFNPNNAYDMDCCKYLFENKDYLTDEEEERFAPEIADGVINDAEYESILGKMTDDERVEKLDYLWRNFVVSDSFEPGSTYKVFTVSGALEDGVISGDEQFYCDGYQQVADYTIKCHNVYGHGMLSVPQALEYSCNDCLMQIAALEGSATFDKYQVLFGFGQRTNVDIAGEGSDADLAAMVYHQDTLNPVELATSSFGQGVTVTMMQLGTAFCSVINGGYYYQPHIVKQIIDEDGNLVKNYDKILVRRTISEETSDEMKEILKEVVENGTGKKAMIEGYEIGGKTGTAEKLPRGNGKYILSFIGFSPVKDPQVVIYCVVDEPESDNQAATAAGTLLFNQIAEDLLPYMNIYKTGTATETDATVGDEIATPVFEGNAPEISVAGSTPEENATEATTEENSESTEE